MDHELGKLSGKTCVVTGATSGIGLAVAKILTRQGGRVIGVGRTTERIASALRETAQEAAEGTPPPQFEKADLSSLREVAALAKRLATGTKRIDVLVNCAGAYTSRRVLTPDGLETQFAVNYLASFLLTTSLLPQLEASPDARVITVSSNSHYYGRIHWGDPSLRRFYLGLWAYEQSKLADVLFSYELARRLGPNSPVTVYTADPGLVNTEMGQKHGLTPSGIFWSFRKRRGTSPDKPARAIAHLASSPETKGRTGLYWKDGVPQRSSRRSYREEDAKRLWAMSERIAARALAQTSSKIGGTNG